MGNKVMKYSLGLMPAAKFLDMFFPLKFLDTSTKAIDFNLDVLILSSFVHVKQMHTFHL